MYYNIPTQINETNFKETVRDAVSRVHCKLSTTLEGPLFDGLYHINCAYSWCNDCPKYDLHNLEKQLMMRGQVPTISFHTYEWIYQCSEHGTIPNGGTECLYCAKKKDEKSKRNVVRLNKLVEHNVPFKWLLR